MSTTTAPRNLLRYAHPAADLYILTWAAGMMDAMSYLRAGVFTANMTGNTVILGLAIAGPERPRVWSCGLATAAFAAGAFLAAALLVRYRPGEWQRDLKFGVLLEVPWAVALAVIWALFPYQGPRWTVAAGIAASAWTLGIQTVAVRRLKISGLFTTFIGGTIATAIISAVERKEAGAPPGKEIAASPFQLAGILIVYLLAAVTGGALASRAGHVAGLTVLVLLLSVLARNW